MTAHFAQPGPAAALGTAFAGTARPRAPRPVGRVAAFDPGHEPPLETGARHVAMTRRALNLRWVLASILIGCTGAALLGSAIYVSSEGDVTFAEPAQRAQGSRGGDGLANLAPKGDKLVRAELAASAKQVFRAPMTLRAGDREVIKIRSFVRLSTGLSLTSGVYATNIPPFNPLRFFSDSGAERIGSESQPETSDAEVTVTRSDLATLAIDPGAPTLSDADVANQFREEAQMRAEAGRRAAIRLPGSMMLSRMLGPRTPGTGAPDGDAMFPAPADMPFRSLDIRVVPENVTSAPKVTAAPDVAFVDKVLPLARAASIEAVLRETGASPEEARAIVATLGPERALAQEGQQLRVLLGPPARPGARRPIARAMVIGERGIEAIAALSDRGAFVSVAPPVQTELAAIGRPGKESDEDDGEENQEGAGVPLYDSLYETALKHDIPRQTIDDLVRIFGYDVDFQRRVSSGDSLEIFAAADEEAGSDRIELLSATLKLGQETKRVFRFQADDGSVDYFDEAGRSLKKFLLRKPVVEARMSSPFGRRFHPILGYSKMHTGVDWAAKTGTPIFAGGNGTVIKAEWSSGYGRRTEVQHANGYVTAYNHQSSFARGLAPGSRIRQGQVIGYVGSTGLSTGAHLHYEVIVNGHFVDPMKIRVPRGRELEGRTLTEFNRQVEQFEQIRRKAAVPGQLAQREAR